MKVLFVYRTYGKKQSNPVVQNQIEGLRNIGLDICEYRISTGGIKSYLNSILGIRRFVKKEKVEIIHAHYSLSGFVSFLALSKPVICSLMGSDVLTASRFKRKFISIFVRYFWKVTIVKSKEMAATIKNAIVIPNGVDLDVFKKTDKKKAQIEVGFDDKTINIIFVATDITAPVKNFKLAKEAVEMLSSNFKIHTLSDATKEELSVYYNAADMLLLTSDSEGSPNVIKEALACCCPIVSTDVGDVKELIEGVKKCLIVERNPEEIALSIENITNTSGRSNGDVKIKELSIKATSIKIKNLYLSLET